jgi:hypothetical protein
MAVEQAHQTTWMYQYTTQSGGFSRQCCAGSPLRSSRQQGSMPPLNISRQQLQQTVALCTREQASVAIVAPQGRSIATQSLACTPEQLLEAHCSGSTAWKQRPKVQHD